MSKLITKTKLKIMKPVFSLVSKPVPVTHIGPNSIDEVAGILEFNRTKKVLIITDKFLLEIGLLSSMLEQIKSKGINTVIFSDVVPDPTFEVVENALAVCEGCEAVIAVGGGSVIDTAKVVAAASTNNVNPKKLEGLFKVKKTPLKFICVPTTAGTGSEVTLVAVISDTKTHKKTTIVDPKIVPDVAILDPNLTLGLPVPMTVYTAMDALTHALEAYISNFANDKTNQYAEIAVKMIYENLSVVYENPKDVKARENLLVASFYAGMAFTRTYVGYVHAFSHNIGGKYGVAHGLANAVLLPHIMEYNKDKCEKKFAQMSDVVGVSEKTDSDKEKADKFINSIFEMNKTMQVPERISDFKKEGVEEIIKAGFKEAHGTYPVPKYMTKKEALNILSKVCSED